MNLHKIFKENKSGHYRNNQGFYAFSPDGSLKYSQNKVIVCSSDGRVQMETTVGNMRMADYKFINHYHATGRYRHELNRLSAIHFPPSTVVRIGCEATKSSYKAIVVGAVDLKFTDQSAFSLVLLNYDDEHTHELVIDDSIMVQILEKGNKVRNFKPRRVIYDHQYRYPGDFDGDSDPSHYGDIAEIEVHEVDGVVKFTNFEKERLDGILGKHWVDSFVFPDTTDLSYGGELWKAIMGNTAATREVLFRSSDSASWNIPGIPKVKK